MIVRVLIASALSALFLTMLAGPIGIPFLRWLKFGQTIREEGPAWHIKKSGTPTMGGLLFIPTALVTAWVFASRGSDLLLVTFAMLSYGLLGGLDDGIKVILRRNLGLTSLQKLLGQTAIALMFYFLLVQNGYRTQLAIPGWESIELGPWYALLVWLVFVATTNAVNITDGLDGLLAGSGAIVFFFYVLIAYTLSRYDLAIFAAALVGALLGFLFFNHYPARIFMGDTGSLALGGALAALALITQTELLLIWLAGLFVIETLSVILQVASFKLRGRRIFRMSPLHHHFEMIGWTEWQVVLVFWGVALAFAASGFWFFLM
ncbi:MAG: Phospho-N-acetylmuramoyl-pentapeptide-transferase [Candidatus Carbobacillus altaicus]|uniref:Phospho-N-acetylmuramoyl-pentapeptide-transferase n=1 Tax=Candidatus Carbonibacillus altaicus TaxID=2163959 RepID=A0A2R6Y340_9BACL|nr:MAG: Phospho-N-acetylmuramoyl-pentapeptide-transferase [Candidatus Carbobacillus altaicus]